MAQSTPMSWAELRSRPSPKPTRSIAYGGDPSQVADLWLPEGEGSHPVVVLIHGGCWQASVADRSYFNSAAEDLRRRGLAVWNIEYRGVDQPGGGYPGTFQDVAAAIDRLGVEAPKLHLSLKNLVVAGHSAGGHLALWVAARHRIAKSSPLHQAAPLRVSAVVDIAGIPNLETDTHTACGGDGIKQLTGVPTEARPNVFSDTSPAHLLPLGVPQVVIHGAQDVTVAPAVGEAYVKAARAAGDHVAFHTPLGAHVEEVAPGTAAWADVSATIIALAHGRPVT
ncbi:S9 family peptidase [Caulobacter sp. S45]|uniref:alpha/beta hydrolase family protein n=1 Tax=Caulobacter sp. S45 TaxID=1641861 RepID=UPI00131D53A1|nr:alpha/beta hydrolase [Caulobacter sp. S45]